MKTLLSIILLLWSQNTPGDRWNCKCHLRNTDKEPTDRPTSDNPCDLRHDGLEGNPAHTGEIFTDNCAYVKSCNRKKKNLVQRYAGDKFLRKETQQSLREVQGKSVSLKKQNEQIDVLFDSKTTSHLSNDVAQSSQFLWNEVMDRMPQILSKSKLVAHEPNTKLDKKPWAVEYYYYEYSIQNHTLYFCIEYNNIVDENRQFYRLYSITSKLRESATRY